jgi:hypothetical protein
MDEMVDVQHTDPFATTGEERGLSKGSQPRLHQHGVEIQRFGQMRLFPIALSHDARPRAASC